MVPISQSTLVFFNKSTAFVKRWWVQWAALFQNFLILMKTYAPQNRYLFCPFCGVYYYPCVQCCMEPFHVSIKYTSFFSFEIHFHIEYKMFGYFIQRTGALAPSPSSISNYTLTLCISFLITYTHNILSLFLSILYACLVLVIISLPFLLDVFFIC